jgi:hypothetical protein
LRFVLRIFYDQIILVNIKSETPLFLRITQTLRQEMRSNHHQNEILILLYAITITGMFGL